MALVGIIANPAASKDIRRLVAQGRVVPDWEKVNTLRRVLVGLQAVGIERVVGMPDASNLCRRSRDDAQVSLELELLDMQVYHEEGDTARAATMMREMGVDCLVTLGGDGTNRAAATGSGQIPIVAISTGTNNVFPTMVEGTLAGLAAGLVAQGKLDLSRISTVSKTLNVYIDGRYRDMALIDVAFSQERFVAARAIWDLSTLYEVFLTRAEPTSIGLAAVGAALHPVTLAEEGGLHYVLDSSLGNEQPGASGPQPVSEPVTVLAAIAPGVVQNVPIPSWRRLVMGERIAVERRYATVALDGERAFSVSPEQLVEVELQRNGPPVVAVDAALKEAAQLGLFRG
ncbi:MAG: NAD(+)/NADH kinase [Chloroflexi bacterium]|nr:NAD(+)/NADH kinase [Chloroflexota bacterium]